MTQNQCSKRKKKQIQEKFRRDTSLLVNLSKPGHDTKYNGNTNRKYYQCLRPKLSIIVESNKHRSRSNDGMFSSSPTLVKLKRESVREYSSAVRQKDKQIISWRILATTEQLK